MASTAPRRPVPGRLPSTNNRQSGLSSAVHSTAPTLPGGFPPGPIPRAFAPPPIVDLLRGPLSGSHSHVDRLLTRGALGRDRPHLVDVQDGTVNRRCGSE